MAAQIESPNQAELRWIGEHLGALADAGVDVTDAQLLGAHYDALLSEWLGVP